MAATAVDAGITPVKQHGFVVKEGPAGFFRPRALAAEAAAAAAADAAPAQPLAAAAARADEGAAGGASALSRASLGLLAPGAAAAAERAAYAATYGVSPGLPRAGDVRPAEVCHLTPGVKRIMRSVMRGLKAHQDPEAATEGLGGTYFFRNEAGAKIAIMKPCDEEPLAPNNPKGFVGRQLGEPGLKPTVRVGEAASREVAAYLLDHDHFARVPHTVMVRMSHPVFHVAAGSAPAPEVEGEEEGALPLKLGSLQEFAPHECDTSEMGASRFALRDVQRIGILDIRLYNTDRHAGNILVRRARGHAAAHASMARLDAPSALPDLYELIPIDHGFALPEGLEPPYFEWQHWPQAMMPFGPEELEYIARLDGAADAELLRRELPGLREESLRLLEVSTTLLKRGAAAGLSLSEIAAVATRPLVGLDDEPSPLEELCYGVRAEVDAAAAEAAGAAGSSSGSDSELSDLDEEEGEEEGGGGGGGPHPAAADMAASLAAALEAAADADVASPTSAGSSSPGSGSAATHFRPAGAASAASRLLDDALFCMDDDDGARTPGPGSPTLGALASAAALARLRAAPALAVCRRGEVATPGGVVGMSFGSALAGTDSLPPSYDSADSPHSGAGAPRAGSATASLDSATTAVGAGPFVGAASYMPGGFATAAKGRRRAGGKARRRREHGGAHGGAAARKPARAQAYPPLVEARTGAGADAAVFSDLTPDQWADFMRRFGAGVDAALRSGAWAQGAGGGGPAPAMSCPRF